MPSIRSMGRPRLVASLFAAASALAPDLSAQAVVEGSVHDVRGPVTDAVVYLVSLADTGSDVPVAEPAAAETSTAAMDQAGLRFRPAVLAVHVGATVEFPNSDPIMHNVFSPSRRGAGFDLGTYPTSESRAYTFDAPGAYLLLCHVHPEMSGWVIVPPEPTFATTEAGGTFRIENVFPGAYEVHVWYRRRDLVTDTIAVADQLATELRIDVPRFGRR